jgi:RNA polymerase sigma factor (sigma-70 family)
MSDGPPPPDVPRLQALPQTQPTDGELIERSVGDPECFATLFDRHATAVHRYLGRRVGDLADDLLGETFLIAFRRRAAYRPEHVEVRPWLIGIATNVVHGHRRSEQRRYRALARASAEPAPSGASTDESHDRLAAEAMRAPLAAALAALKDRDRDVLLLFAYAQLSYEEIAAVLDVPLGTVRSRLNRARRQTRAALGTGSPFRDTSIEETR